MPDGRTKTTTEKYSETIMESKSEEMKIQYVQEATEKYITQDEAFFNVTPLQILTNNRYLMWRSREITKHLDSHKALSLMSIDMINQFVPPSDSGFFVTQHWDDIFEYARLESQKDEDFEYNSFISSVLINKIIFSVMNPSNPVHLPYMVNSFGKISVVSCDLKDACGNEIEMTIMNDLTFVFANQYKCHPKSQFFHRFTSNWL